MTQRNLTDAVNRIHADAILKEKVLNTLTPSTIRKAGYGFIKYAVSFASLLIVVVGAFFLPQVLKQTGTVGPASAPVSGTGLLPAESSTHNILLIGLDEGGRSDLVMLLSVNQQKDGRQWTLIPFPRDLYLDVPGNGKNKLSAVYSLGGGALCAKTIAQNFNLSVDDYVAVDYAGVERVIDRLGGISVEITEHEAPLINRYSGESSEKYLKAGRQTLTGKQALYYARIRSLDGELMRNQREQAVVSSIISKMSAENGGLSLFDTDTIRLLSFIKSTSITENRALDLAKLAFTCRNFTIDYFKVSQDHIKSKQVAVNGSMTEVLVPDQSYIDLVHLYLNQNEA